MARIEKFTIKNYKPWKFPTIITYFDLFRKLGELITENILNISS